MLRERGIDSVVSLEKACSAQQAVKTLQGGGQGSMLNPRQ
jgi:hypothetical protein